VRFAIDEFQILAILFVANVAFYLNGIEQAFQKFLEECEKWVVSEETVDSFADCNLEAFCIFVGGQLLKFY